MVKEFRVVLAPPLQNGYITNSEVTGHVVLVTDEAKSGYKAIEHPQRICDSTLDYDRYRRESTNEYILLSRSIQTLLFFGAGSTGYG